MEGEQLLLEVRPSRLNYFGHYALAIVFVVISVAGHRQHHLVTPISLLLALIPIVMAELRRSEQRLQVFHERVVLERGLLSRSVKEIFSADVRGMDMTQTLGQRLFGIGDIKIQTSGGSAEYEEVMNGVPSPQSIVDLITQQKRLTSQSPEPGA